MGRNGFLDFDGDGLDLVRDAYSMSEEYQSPIFNQYQRDWLAYLAYKDMRERDPNMPNITLPKIYNIVENKSPDNIDSLFGRRPVLPYTANREEFRPVTEVITDYVDDLLDKAKIFVEGSLATKIKVLYGTAYMNVLPYYKKIREKVLRPMPDGTFGITTQEAYRLRLRIETWAPWEIMRDPHATDLYSEEGCRYIIKVQLASKRDIMRLYEQGGYPELDVERLNGAKRLGTDYGRQHWGQKMLTAYGLATPMSDDDMGLILRYESVDRYVDTYVGSGGEILLRDIPNPFATEHGGHGLINLSKLTHTQPPHTQWRWDGIGEAKPNEIQVAMLNDLMNLTFRAHGLMNQPTVFYRKDNVDRDEIIFGLGRRVGVDSESDRPISDDVLIHTGAGLPRDHYLLQEKTERNIDMTANLYAPGRGEATDTDNTATEIQITEAKGDNVQEQMIRLNEQEFAADFGNKIAAIVEQSAIHDDYVESVGERRAMLMVTANPADLPGGHNFSFKGSGRVREMQMKQRSMRLLAPLIQNSIAARPGGFERKLAEVHDLTEEEINSILLTEEELQIQQRTQALLQMMGGAANAQMGQIENNNKEKEAGLGSKPSAKTKQQTSAVQ